jgi:hypothetical protein
MFQGTGHCSQVAVTDVLKEQHRKRAEQVPPRHSSEIVNLRAAVTHNTTTVAVTPMQHTGQSWKGTDIPITYFCKILYTTECVYLSGAVVQQYTVRCCSSAEYLSGAVVQQYSCPVR